VSKIVRLSPTSGGGGRQPGRGEGLIERVVLAIDVEVAERDQVLIPVSTHYPSPTVTADGGGPVYYQQHVLGIVPQIVRGGLLERSTLWTASVLAAHTSIESNSCRQPLERWLMPFRTRCRLGRLVLSVAVRRLASQDGAQAVTVRR
jgi:hypothetical protein